MFIYSQSTGQLKQEDVTIAIGYSGNGVGKNNPAGQNEPNVGPLPQGRYIVGWPYDDAHKGPVVMRLDPAPDNEMFGRAGFLIHGDNATHDASEGCIILPRTARETIAASTDRFLQVTA